MRRVFHSSGVKSDLVGMGILGMKGVMRTARAAPMGSSLPRDGIGGKCADGHVAES
jgi:hypothetical protein